MRKFNVFRIILLSFFGFVLIAFGCATNKNHESSTETIQFKNLSINMNIPGNWKSVRSSGTQFSGAETQDRRVTPPSGEKALIMLTFGKPNTGAPLTNEQFLSFANNRAAALLPHAVEKEVRFIELPLNGGQGIYCILTDSSLVNVETPADNDYRYLAVYFANYEKGFFVHGTVLTDDITNDTFQQMLNILSSIN
ncbi:MAG: hypothetical protein LBU88_07830 [Treponema sp.]|nr:hypothetical protein [Treponema sp.]